MTPRLLLLSGLLSIPLALPGQPVFAAEADPAEAGATSPEAVASEAQAPEAVVTEAVVTEAVAPKVITQESAATPVPETVPAAAESSAEPSTGSPTEIAPETTADGVPVRIADPYVDLHTGPGRGYPKFQVVERGGLITIIERRTDWFLVRTPRNHQGWVHRDQMLRTLNTDGEAIAISEAQQSDFSARTWEFGVMSGEFANVPVVSLYGAWGFTENLSLELTLGHVMGDFSNAEYATLHLTHQPFPEWWISPYFQLGTGYIQTDPAATIIQTDDRNEQLSQVGVGVRTYLTRRFVFRAEYNRYVVLTDRNDNENVEEWKAGFSLFF